MHITKLFGVFDHDIPLNQTDRLTILHGLNGVGKTTLLQVIDAVASGKFHKLRRIPFLELILKFDDGQELSVHRKQIDKNLLDSRNNISHYEITINLLHKGSNTKTYTLSSRFGSKDSGVPTEFIFSHIEHMLDGLEKIGPETWLELSTGRKLDLEEVINEFGEYDPFLRSEMLEKSEPSWLRELRKTLQVRLIPSQRLLNVDGTRNYKKNSGNSPSIRPAVQIYANELASKIRKIQADYGAKSQELDSSFPSRAIGRQTNQTLGVIDLKAKLTKLEEHRQSIINAGLLSADHSGISISDTIITEAVKGILAIHAEDVESKLEVFGAILNKVNMLKKLVNAHFKWKRLEVNGEDGFKIVTQSDDKLQVSDLSSGEQHELTLIYELLFRTSENTLILIDEPELSLHLSWQNDFLKNLFEIIDLSKLDVLIATHSPHIIANHWDKTVELSSPIQPD